MPPGMNEDETAIAQLLDASGAVKWWHRNPPRTGVGLYRWDEGKGYFPDFVVCLESRQGSDIALLEVTGAHLSGNDDDVEKTKAIHRDYGRVYMVGRARGEREFRFLRELGGKLQGAGPFSIDAMRYP